ncbi:hypothetical protein [Duganella sp. Root1480D1]|uniref:hypothetical protein n=1 Tax=Duganella sp. Root1480D1 TaxID=1736471 RepID=UPI0012E3CF8F|nr:hypothetical protein [Duganella sp. Root1480D1]
MKIFSALLIWIVVSVLAFRSLPSLQQTGESLAIISIATLIGPIAGIFSVLTQGVIEGAYPVLIFANVVCGLGIFWWQNQRTIWSFLVTSFLWTITGLYFTVGIYA